MKWFTLPAMAVLGIGQLPACFAESYTWPAQISPMSQVYSISRDVSNRNGQVDEKYSYSIFSNDAIVYRGVVSFSMNKYTIGPQYYRGTYSPDIDMAQSVKYNGRTYYRIKKITDAEVYVSVIQPFKDYNTGATTYHAMPYTVNNGARAEFYTSSGCAIKYNNSPMTISCTQDAYDINIDAEISSSIGKSGDLYVYIPRVPTKEINIGSITISSVTVSGTGISTEGWEKASSLSKNSAQANLINFVLSGTLKFNNNCRLLNTTGGIAINFQDLAPGAFTGKGNKPNGVTPVKTDIVFNCDKDIGNTYAGMNWAVTATANSTSSEPGILKATGSEGNTINNLGVKLTKDVNGATPVNILGQENPATISGANATATFYAFPTMMTDKLPSGAGGYIATATVTFNVP